MCVCLKSVLLARSELLHVQLLVVVLFVACPFLSSDWNTAWLVSQVAQYHTLLLGAIVLIGVKYEL